MSRLDGTGRRRDVDDIRVACDACLLVSITVRKKCCASAGAVAAVVPTSVVAA